MKWIVLLLSLATLGWAADPKLHTARPTSSPNQIYVQFDTPVALTDCDVEFPQRPGCATSTSVAPWSVVVYDGSGNPVVATVSSVADVIGQFQANGLLTMTLKDPIAAGFSRVDITYTKGKAPHISLTPASTPPKHWISPAKTKDDSDVYISG